MARLIYFPVYCLSLSIHFCYSDNTDPTFVEGLCSRVLRSHFKNGMLGKTSHLNGGLQGINVLQGKLKIMTIYVKFCGKHFCKISIEFFVTMVFISPWIENLALPLFMIPSVPCSKSWCEELIPRDVWNAGQWLGSWFRTGNAAQILGGSSKTLKIHGIFIQF